MKMAGAGFEPTQESPTISNVLCDSGAQSGASQTQSEAIDPDLATVIEVWHTLPGSMRAGIVAIVRGAK
jgi:hypothetical protein